MNLPLTNNPEESFNVTINDVIVNIRQLWNTYGFWTLDLKDADGNTLVLGVKTVTKVFLLKQYPHIEFDLRSTNDDDPTRNNLDSFILEVSIK